MSKNKNGDLIKIKNDEVMIFNNDANQLAECMQGGELTLE